MRPLNTFVLAVIALALAGSTYAAIYKTVDEDGNVVFTDVPPKDAGQAVELKRGNDYAPTVTPERRQPVVVEDGLLGMEEDSDNDEMGLLNPDGNSEAQTPAPVGYTALKIVSPAPEAAIRNNEGLVTVSVQLEPGELDRVRDHQIRILLDGMPAGDASGGALTIKNVDRGTHSLTAEVVDPAGEVHIQSSPVVFHLQRYSQLQGRRAN